MAVETAARTRRHGDIARGDADEVGCGAVARAHGMASGRDRHGQREFHVHLNRQKLRKGRRRERRYLLRTNLTANDPALLWQYYIQLVAVEQAFKT